MKTVNNKPYINISHLSNSPIIQLATTKAAKSIRLIWADQAANKPTISADPAQRRISQVAWTNLKNPEITSVSSSISKARRYLPPP